VGTSAFTTTSSRAGTNALSTPTQFVAGHRSSA
jgi:hypothetical protein